MPSRASNALLMVVSRPDRDIGISLTRGNRGGDLRGFCRDLKAESQEHTLVMAGLVPAIHVFPRDDPKTRMPGASPGMAEIINRLSPTPPEIPANHREHDCHWR